MSKVLIVDDERLIIEYVGKLLSSYGYDYDFIPKPKFLYEKLDSESFDLILLDINMEGQDGVNILKELKSSEKYRDYTVIMMTGEANQNVISKCFELGVADYITKPIRELEFKARVESSLKLQEFVKKVSKQNDDLAKSQKIIMDSVKKIRDSIDAAKRIQNAMLPSLEKIKENIPDTFIFYKPKDVVSGDFYWFDTIDDKMIMAVGDCTGHGVPGAFMTALGTTLLKEIVLNQGTTNPEVILEELNKSLVNILTQDQLGEEVQEGMDLGICTIDPATKSIEFAGARRPLVYVKDEEISVLKGSKKSVGIQPEEFTSLEFFQEKIDIEADTTYYLYSDGFQDQFNEDNSKKYSRKRLFEVFVDISKDSMEKQVDVLEKELTDWKGSNQQVDDILILGFRL
ncbi:MAG: response regulator [Cyclobacteriaceae bacterium]